MPPFSFEPLPAQYDEIVGLGTLVYVRISPPVSVSPPISYRSTTCLLLSASVFSGAALSPLPTEPRYRDDHVVRGVVDAVVARVEVCGDAVCADVAAIGVSVAFTVDDRAGGCRRIAGGGSASEVEVAAPFEEDLEGGRHDLGAPRAVGGHLERGAGVGAATRQ